MFSGDMGRHQRRNRSAAAPPRTQGHVAGQSIHGRHGPTTALIATGHAHAHLIRHRACEQTCPAPTARPEMPGRGCHRPPRPTFAVTVQEHLNTTQDHQKVCISTPSLSTVFVVEELRKISSYVHYVPIWCFFNSRKRDVIRVEAGVCTARLRGMETAISETSKRVSICSFATQ